MSIRRETVNWVFAVYKPIYMLETLEYLRRNPTSVVVLERLPDNQQVTNFVGNLRDCTIGPIFRKKIGKIQSELHSDMQNLEEISDRLNFKVIK